MPAGQRLYAFIRPVGQPVEFASLLEGRIDQHQPALLLGRQMSAERQPAVEFDDAHLVVAGKQVAEIPGILGMKLDRGQPVLAAQQAAHDEGRAGIVLETAAGVGGGNRVQIRRHQPGGRALRRHVEKPADAAAPFARPLRGHSGKVVKASTGMRVDHAKGLVLQLQVFDQPGKHDMLDYVSEIAGMEGVAVVHAPPAAPLPQRGPGGCWSPPPLPRPPRRNDIMKPMKPTAISEKPIGCARSS